MSETEEIMDFKEFNQMNYKVNAYLMQHISRIDCQTLNCANSYENTIIIMHKTLCKDDKYRVYKWNKEYCGFSLLIRLQDGEGVPFSSTEMKSLKKLYQYCLNNNLIPNLLTRYNRLQNWLRS